MEAECELFELRQEVERFQQAQSRPGYRWPKEIKERIKALCREGMSSRRIAEELRVNYSTVCSWTNPPVRKPKRRFREIQVKEPQIKIVLIGPRGHRVEGLNIGTIRQLIGGNFL